MKPVLNPAEDLKGATPETLASALLRRRDVKPAGLATGKSSRGLQGSDKRRSGKGR